MAFLLNGQPLGVDLPFTDADGIQYPANWMRHASADEKAAIGITEVADPERYDERCYWGVGNPKALEDDGYTKGLKSVNKSPPGLNISIFLCSPRKFAVTCLTHPSLDLAY